MRRTEQFAPRLKKVHVHSGNYLPLVRKYDAKDTAFFLDPPYAGYNVQVGEDAFDEEEFYDVLTSIKDRWLLTYGQLECGATPRTIARAPASRRSTGRSRSSTAPTPRTSGTCSASSSSPTSSTRSRTRTRPTRCRACMRLVLRRLQPVADADPMEEARIRGRIVQLKTRDKSITTGGRLRPGRHAARRAPAPRPPPVEDRGRVVRGFLVLVFLAEVVRLDRAAMSTPPSRVRRASTTTSTSPARSTRMTMASASACASSCRPCASPARSSPRRSMTSGCSPRGRARDTRSASSSTSATSSGSGS